MTLTWNPGDDFLDAVDALETVTLTLPGGATTAVSGALRLRITEEEVASSGGKLTHLDVRWHLPAEQVVAAPSIGATITDAAGRVWTILQVDHDTRSSRWRCSCRTANLPSALTDQVTVQQATWSKDAHGGLVPSWSNWQTNLPARVQPVAGLLAHEHDRRIARMTHLVQLAEPLNLSHNHRLQHAGDTLHILGWEWPTESGGLFTIRAEYVD